MARTRKFKSWHMCTNCGKKYFPKMDESKLTGITVCLGTCPECGQIGLMLIPISDFEYASGDYAKWD